MFDVFEKVTCRFRNDERGTIAVVFALLAIMLVLVGGFAVDYARALHSRAKINNAIDAAALAAVKALRVQNLSDPEVLAIANTIFYQNYNANGATNKGVYADINSITATIDHANSAVSIAVDAEVKTLFGGLAGINKIPLAKSGAAVYETRDIEVSIQLDVTGSMSGTKIADLKVATKTLIDILLPDTPTGQKVRIGYAPYAAGVNAGAYASAVNGNVSAPDNCVYERISVSEQDTDNAPIGTSALKTKLALPSALNCPNATVPADDRQQDSAQEHGRQLHHRRLHGRPSRHGVGLVPSLSELDLDLAGGKQTGTLQRAQCTQDCGTNDGWKVQHYRR